MKEDNVFMQRCFQLALNGLGRVAPNPMVGCIIVKNNIVIAEGFHQEYGKNHAERNAINSVDNQALLKDATLYVNLEPCSHFGKTPPCCDLIIEKKIARVVISNTDPNPLVAGIGINKLRDAGIEVCVGVLEKQGYELNKRFFTFFTKQRPYIILKWAETLDGFMDVDRSLESIQNNWITNKQLKVLSHKWRTEESAILVGTNTVKNDNPQLTARLWKGNNPIRIVIDRHLRLAPSCYVFDKTVKTIVFTEKEEPSEENLEFVPINFENMLSEILTNLHKRAIQSLIVEGGKQVLEVFLKQNCWDEIRLLVGNKKFIKGLEAPKQELSPIEEKILGNNKLYYFRNKE